MSDPHASLLETVAAAIIAASNAALATAGMTIPSGPGFCHTAPTVPLGEQTCPDILGVWFDAIDARPYGERRPQTPGDLQVNGFHTVLPIRIDYWRFYTQLTDSGSEPEPADINLNAGQAARGAWAIWCHLCDLRNAQTLFTNIGPNMTPIQKRDIGIGSLRPLPPSGFAAGWRVQLELMVPTTFGA